MISPNLSSASEPSDRDRSLTNLRAVAGSDPVKDFAAAKAKGDIRFLAMMGYARFVPGVPDYDQKYAKVVGVKIIPGTTDAIKSDEQRRLQDAVQSYAERYNKLVVEYLSKRKGKR
jgi:hypothetical protein